MGFASSFPGGGYHSAPDTPSTDGIDFVGALGAAPADVQTGLGIAAANGYSVDSGNQLSIPQYTPEQAELANAVATELGQTTSANQQTSINNAVLAQQYNKWRNRAAPLLPLLFRSRLPRLRTSYRTTF